MFLPNSGLPLPSGKCVSPSSRIQNRRAHHEINLGPHHFLLSVKHSEHLNQQIPHRLPGPSLNQTNARLGHPKYTALQYTAKNIPIEFFRV
jgi:hypothetical protein